LVNSDVTDKTFLVRRRRHVSAISRSTEDNEGTPGAATRRRRRLRRVGRVAANRTDAWSARARPGCLIGRRSEAMTGGS